MKSVSLTEEQMKSPPARHNVLKPRVISNIPGVTGTLPLQPGEVILTEREKKKLSKFGWKEGDPLPGNIADLMARARTESLDELRTARPFKNKPVFQAPEPVDIKDLTEAKRVELTTHLQKFKEMAPQIEAAVKSQQHMASLPPEIQKALKDAGGVEVVDSRGEPEDTAKEFQRRIDEAEGRRQPREEDGTGLEEEEKKPEEEKPAHSESCPRCNWKLAEKPPEPAKEDKLNYVAAILGDKTFEKTYELFGGKLKVGFKQLTTSLSDMIFDQVAHEVRMGITDNGYRRIMLYRMTLALNTITVGDAAPIEVASAIGDFINEDDQEVGKHDVLPLIVNRLQQTEPLNKESVWRACRECFDRFNNLLDDLDARADNPDFWNAIES